MDRLAKLRVALVHHWLVTQRGGERVLEAVAELFPSADIFTLVCGATGISESLRNRTIRASFLQKLPHPAHWYPYYLALFPAATARLDLSGYDLIISSDAAVVKAVRADPGAVHICYCHTPMRCVWSGYETYRDAAGPATRLALAAVRDWLRRGDYEAAQRVTHFVANSRNVQNRIRKCYGRESAVVYPPVDTRQFVPGPKGHPAEDFFLLVSQLVAYKRVDVVVEAFNQSGKNLLVIGEGPERRKLEARANSNVRFLGAQPQEVIVSTLQKCKAFVFAGEEDFGIVMTEAQACGKPVIALAKGGALEIVRPGLTGVLFEEQTAGSLRNAVEQLAQFRFDAATIRATALRFGRERFFREFFSLCQEMVDGPRGADRKVEISRGGILPAASFGSHPTSSGDVNGEP